MKTIPLAAEVDLWVYNLAEQRAMLLTEVADLRFETQLQGLEEMTFKLPLDHPKVDYLQADLMLEFESKFYVVRDFDDSHPGWREIRADARWIRLAWRSRSGPFPVLAKTPLQGLTQILAGTGWSVGTVDDSSTLFSIEDIDATILALLRRWASVTGRELSFNTSTRTVNLLLAVGEDKGVGFRYGHNLRELKRTYKPPQATRLIPFGANNLDITAVNPSGLNYIENYDWYTDQGLSLTDARAKYRKDLTWVREEYLLPVNLYDAAVAYLAQLSQPVIAYSGKVLNLTRLTESDADDFNVGDVVVVDDEVLDVQVETRVVRLVRYPYSPQSDEIELQYLNSGLLEATTEGSRAINYGELAILVDQNLAAGTVTGSTFVWASIAVTVAGESTIVFGGTFVGTATGSGTITFGLYQDGTPVGVEYSFPFNAATNTLVEFSWPTMASGIGDGSYIFEWRARVSSGSGTVAYTAGSCRGWLLSRGAVGVGVNTNPSQALLELIPDFVPDPVSDSFSIDLSTPLSIEFADELGEPDVEDLIEALILPFTIGDPVFGVLDGIGGLS